MRVLGRAIWEYVYLGKSHPAGTHIAHYRRYHRGRKKARTKRKRETPLVAISSSVSGPGEMAFSTRALERASGSTTFWRRPHFEGLLVASFDGCCSRPHGGTRANSIGWKLNSNGQSGNANQDVHTGSGPIRRLTKLLIAKIALSRGLHVREKRRCTTAY